MTSKFGRKGLGRFDSQEERPDTILSEAWGFESFEIAFKDLTNELPIKIVEIVKKGKNKHEKMRRKWTGTFL